ncbi:hypothetical protein AM493_01215 [Flavobacterium akiainvivens]|uniref:histidine kinase n=1 Tax=Flavobacterium akiainvivens TaxID=1202724 RepID=A0A0M8MAV2_9FLAO|nr:tetratricopeptide repeat-containing sensor histidine kinase [Flavobacterium akiainvivens]KOS04814.1 hypothetical protein AM493_01215 [Flavobacterium akiainvivens]SFQ43781.1 Tetratricopeptide repeat-containing protein [Flavobacterium akiainvivens]
MKLSIKICSPFIILFLVLLCSCHNGNTSFGKAQPQETVLKLSKNESIAFNCFTKQKYEAAYRHYIKLRGDYLAIKDTANAGYACYMMAQIQMTVGDYNGCENTAVDALKLLKVVGKRGNLVSTYNLLGIVSRKILDYDNAIVNYKKAAAYTSDSLSIYIIYNNIASLYITTNHYRNAIEILEKIIKSSYVSADPQTKARVLDNLGWAYSKVKKPEALTYLKSGLQLREKIGDLKGLISSYHNLHNFYITVNKPLALQYALMAYKTASQIKNNEEKLIALKEIIKSTDGKQRNMYTNEFMILDDFLNKERSKTENKFAKIKYDYSEMKAERDKTVLKSQRDKLLITVLILVAGFILLITVFLFIAQRLKLKKAKLEETYKAEGRISKKIHDELANDVFETIVFTQTLQLDNPAKKDMLLKTLDKVYEKTRDISRENANIDADADFHTILIEMLALFKTKEVNILPVNAEAIAWNTINEYKKNTLHKVLRELMVNMKKHSQATLVTIKFTINNKKLVVTYADNGIGIKKESFIRKNGLQNAESRIKLVNGTVTFDEISKGVKISIVIPL